ncbi:ankyrin repeat-containing domain protein [Chytriomyces cf. hyalinus JEL632]|nr:ankyrin repeat-containing domain protein [Chytriomyces cf. hyalinus JEL632]
MSAKRTAPTSATASAIASKSAAETRQTTPNSSKDPPSTPKPSRKAATTSAATTSSKSSGSKKSPLKKSNVMLKSKSAAALTTSSRASSPRLPTKASPPSTAKRGTNAATAAAARNHQLFLNLQHQYDLELQREKDKMESKTPLTRNEELLMNACKEGDVDVVYQLVLKKVDVNCRVPFYGTTPLSAAYRNNHKNVCNLLTAFGAKLDPDNYGVTPLHWAAHNGHSRLIKDQLERGNIRRPDIQKRDFFGSTPLHFASVNNLQETVKSLLECGSDSLITNNDGRMASDVTGNPKLQRILQDAQRLDTETHKRNAELARDDEAARRTAAREAALAGSTGPKKTKKKAAPDPLANKPRARSATAKTPKEPALVVPPKSTNLAKKGSGKLPKVEAVKQVPHLSPHGSLDASKDSLGTARKARSTAWAPS